jgi:hypothetical protein
MMMLLQRKTATGLVSAVFASFCLLLAGCSSTALPPGKSVLDVAQNKAQDPLAQVNQPLQSTSSATGFAWEQQVLSATGKGSAPEGIPPAQAGLVASNSARVHALAQLKEQIKDLPVGTDQTVGSIMNTYLTIRHAIEQELASASITGQRQLASGMEIQVTMSMQNVARILQQYHITTDQELPAAGDAAPASVPDII